MVPVLLLAAALACAIGCGGLTSRLRGSASPIDQAQARIGFLIRLPKCLPAVLDPLPARATVHDEHDPGYQKGYQDVDVEYDYRVRPTQPSGSMRPAVGIIEAKTLPNLMFLMRVGQHKTLDGIEVVVNAPPLTPGMEWIQDGIHFDLVTTLSWDDTLRIYHSMVTGSAGCELPRSG